MGTLSEKFSNWKTKRQLIRSERIYIIPSDICFMSTCSLPEGKIKASTIENIALLSLESASPFPLNDILWGYFVDRQTSTIYIFSALKARLKTMYPEIEGTAYVFPDFILAIIDPSITNTLLKYQDSQVILEKKVSTGIAFKPFDASHDEIPSIPILELMEVTPVPEFGLVIQFTKKEHASAETIALTYEFPFTDPVLTAANMQSSEIKKTQRRDKLITCAMLYTTIAAIVLITAGICGWFVLHHFLSTENKLTQKLNAKDESIKKIQQKEDRTHELDLFSNKKYAYFRGLEKINSLRPDSIFFRSLYASEGENFEIKCSAKTLSDVDEFQKKLSKSMLFKVIRIENKSVKNNQTIDFSLFLTFEKL